MSKKSIVIVTAVILGGIATVCLVRSFMAEPLHKGKPISYWVDRACLGLDGEESRVFRDEVPQIGLAALPRLRQHLRSSGGWRKLRNWIRSHLPPSWQRRFQAVPLAKELHYGAARTLAMFGPIAKPAVLDLARLLPEIPHPALSALTAIGPDAEEAVPALHSFLTNSPASLHVTIAGTLWHIARETNTVLEVCTNALSSGTESLNAGALLMNLLTAAAPAVPFALNIVQDTNQDSGVRANAASVLGAARVSSPEILTALVSCSDQGQDGILRSNSVMALWRLDPAYAPFATRLILEEIVLSKQRFPGNKQDFSMWLKVRDLDPNESIPTLKQLMENESPEIRKEAAEALQRVEARRYAQ